MTSMTRDGQVEFRFFRPNVRSVRLVGDFNGRGRDAFPMTDSGDGWWTTRLNFGPGEYRFNYLADDQWFTDYAAFGVELTRTGSNSILMVPEIQGACETQQNMSAKLVA